MKPIMATTIRHQNEKNATTATGSTASDDQEHQIYKKKTLKNIHKEKSFSCLNFICWIMVPIAAAILLILDGYGLYAFTKERLIVLGVGLVVILLPFFSEINVKNFSVKREKR